MDPKISLKISLAIFLVAIMVGCVTLLPKTFQEKVAAAYTLVSTVRSLNLTLSQAEKIPVTEVKNIQEQCDNFRLAIEVTRQVHSTDPATAEEQIAATILALEGLEAYLRSK